MARSIIIDLPEQLHCKIYGQGPPIILFHPSPNSSAMMEPFAQVLAAHHTVICPDTPGYGLSDKLNIDEPSIEDYVHRFKMLFDALHLKTFSIYGSATGAQIAIRYGIAYPESISYLFLDNCAHFTDKERLEIKANYFPDLQPIMDGSHLSKVWDIVSNLFSYFPWCFQDEAHKLSGPAPTPEVLHRIALDYLRAGPDYDLAYRAAFDHEKAEYINELTVPTTIFRWEGSILKKYTDRIFEHNLPAHIAGKIIPADRNIRNQSMSAYILEQDKNGQTYTLIDSILSLDNDLFVHPDSDHIIIDHLPAPDSEGVYLKDAWNMVKSSMSNGDQSESDAQAMEIQHRLIVSYLNHSTT